MLKSALTIAILLAALPAMAQTPAAKPAPAPSKSPTTAPAQGSGSALAVDPAKATAVRHLMEITGSAKLGDDIGTYVTNQVKQGAAPGITPSDRLQKFMEEFSKEFATHFKPSQVDDNAVTIYASNLSMQDIQDITTFYESPAGQRMIKALPVIVQQSQNLGVQMAQAAALTTLRSMSTEYPELKSMLPPDQPSLAPTPVPGAGSGQPPSNAPKLTPIPQQPH